MKRRREALIRWKLQHQVREAIERARAECVKRGVEPDEAFEAKLMNAAGRAVILGDEAKPGKGGR